MSSADLLPPELSEVEDVVLDSAAQMEQSAATLDLEDWIVQRLKRAEREISIHLPLLRATGDALACTGILVQHSSARGPCLGPVLFSRDAHLAQLRELALHITLQCCLLDLPVGGSAGAIVCDPAHLTESEIRQLVEDYLWSLRDISGPHASIFAPAEYAGAWMHRLSDPAAIVCKPAELGGIPDAPAAIATGWLTLIWEACSGPPATSLQPRKATVEGCRVAIQGFSPAAAALARLLTDAGARVIALADKSGGLMNERGLDIAAVAGHVQHSGMLYGFAHADAVRNIDVLQSACDVLVTAATERQVNAQNVAHIHAPLILEAVHNAVTPSAASVLESHGQTVIPCLLGTAPATLAWVAEWQHSVRSCLPRQGEVEATIRQQLADAFQHIRAALSARPASLSETCRRLALERLAAVLRLTR